MSGRHRGFAFVMFKEHSSVAKVVAPAAGSTRLHEFRPGKYVEVKRAAEKDNAERGAEDAMQRASTKPKLKNVCMDCQKPNPKFCMPNGAQSTLDFHTSILPRILQIPAFLLFCLALLLELVPCAPL